MMFKRFFPNSRPGTFLSSVFLLLFLNLLVKPLWIFAIDRQVQNIVGLAMYGKYFALFNITIIFNFLLDPGITVFYTLRASAHKELMPQQFFQTALFKFYLGTAYAIILAIVAYVSGINNPGLLFALGLVQFLFSFFLFLRSHITAMQLFSVDAWLSVIDKSLMIISCGLLIYMPGVFGPIDITKFVLLQIASTLLSIFLAIGIIRGKGIRGSIRNKISFSTLRNAWPYGLIVLVMSAINRQDAFLLNRLHPNGDYEAGIYAGAYRLLDAANMIGYLVAAFLLPYISRNWDNIHLKKVLVLCRNLLLVIAMVVIAITMVFAHTIAGLLYHSNFSYQVLIIQLCMPAIIGYYLVQVYGTVLTASGNIRLFLKISIPFLFFNLVSNIWMIPAYGARACCIIAVITQLSYGTLLSVVARKKILERTGIVPND